MPLTPAEAQKDIRDLLAWQPVPLDVPLTLRAWHYEQRFQLAFWDALIVAAAHRARCRFLLTEDLQHDQDLDGVVVVNPFLVAPSLS